MERRLKVLMSAYACEPGKGSEPEVGWQWALQMARFHDVTVVTRANNRAAIEAGLSAGGLSCNDLRFVYFDLGETARRWKKRVGASRAYYWLWQRRARTQVARLVRSTAFDLIHHTTFAGYRYPIAVAGHRIPSLWGPVGGIELNPWRLMPWRHLPSLVSETTRNLLNSSQWLPYSDLRRRAASVTQVLASTREMHGLLQRLGVPSTLLPTIGLSLQGFEKRPTHNLSHPLRLLFVGKVISWKGVDLAIEALRESRTSASLTLVGEGNYTDTCTRIAGTHDLSGRVHFVGSLPREQVLRLYHDYDVFIFPSLHDTGGFAVIEAMATGLPVICLDCGGPGMAVAPTHGIRVPLANRTRVVDGLATAIRRYDKERTLLAVHGAAARSFVAEHFDWGRKATVMDQIYHETILKDARRASK